LFEPSGQLSLFVTHSFLEKEESLEGYLLLCVIQSYLNLDTYIAMEVHMTETIEQGRKAAAEYEKVLNVCIGLHFLDSLFGS